LDARLLRSPQSATVEVARRLRRKTNMEGALFLCPKPPLRDFTKAMDPGSTMPSWRSGNNHGFCVTGGHSPIASEPTPSPRLWAASPDATPAKLCEYYYEDFSMPSQSGTFYLAGNRNFLFGSDRFCWPTVSHTEEDSLWKWPRTSRNLAAMFSKRWARSINMMRRRVSAIYRQPSGSSFISSTAVR